MNVADIVTRFLHNYARCLAGGPDAELEGDDEEQAIARQFFAEMARQSAHLVSSGALEDDLDE